MSAFISSDPDTQENDKRVVEEQGSEKNKMTNLVLSWDAATGQLKFGGSDKLESMPQEEQQKMYEKIRNAIGEKLKADYGHSKTHAEATNQGNEAPSNILMLPENKKIQKQQTIRSCGGERKKNKEIGGDISSRMRTEPPLSMFGDR